MSQAQARTPPVLIRATDAAKKMNINKKRYMQLVTELKKQRRTYEDRWKAIREYQLPYVGQFDDTKDDEDGGRRKDTSIYHSIAWEANQVFAAGIMSGLTPQSRQWFRLKFSSREMEDNTEAQRLLDEHMTILEDVLNKSNFYNAVHSCYLELAFGQAALGIFPSGKTGVHFTPFTIGTYYLANGADGNVDTFLREYRMTARQLEEKFGRESLPINLQNELELDSGSGTLHKVYWLVEKNPVYEEGKIDKFHMPYSSLYWMENSQEDEWLEIGGFYEWPVPVGRYLVVGNDAYGKGPGWFAEGDSKGLQILEQDDITAVELGIKPPTKSDADTAMGGINLVPGGNTVTEGGGQVEPLYNVNVNLQHLSEKVAELAERIKRTYNADLFLMLDNLQDKSMTAREVLERTQEKMQQLGPMVQRMQFEFISKIIERVYNILDRAQMFPQPQDPVLQQMMGGEEIKIEYISPLAQAQKLSGLVNIEQAIGFTAQLAQFDPSVLQKVDFITALDKYYDALGAPAAIKRSKEEFEQLQQQKAEAEAQEKQLQQTAMMAQAAAPAAQAAKNATEAANDGNAVLRQWMGIDQYGMGGGA